MLFLKALESARLSAPLNMLPSRIIIEIKVSIRTQEAYLMEYGTLNEVLEKYCTPYYLI